MGPGARCRGAIFFSFTPLGFPRKTPPIRICLQVQKGDQNHQNYQPQNAACSGPKKKRPCFFGWNLKGHVVPSVWNMHIFSSWRFFFEYFWHFRPNHQGNDPIRHAIIFETSSVQNPGCSFRVLGRARFWSCAPHSKRLFLCILNIVSYGFGSTRGQGPRLSIRPTGRNVFVFVRDVTHVQTCEKGALFFKFLGHTWNMSKPEMTFVFKVLRNRLLRYILETCPNMWWCSCSKCYAIDCFGTYFKHVQTCDDVRVRSATQSTASVHASNMSKPAMTFVFKVLRNRLLRCILDMSKPVMTFVFEVLRNRLLRFIRRRRRRRRRRKAREEDQMFKIWVLCRVCSATL